MKLLSSAITGAALLSGAALAMPAARSEPGVVVQDCGRWVLKHGGPQEGGACGDGYEYNPDSEVCPKGDNDMCQSVCCKEILVYRREVKPRMGIQECASWVVDNGGPQEGGACGDGYEYDENSEVCPSGNDATCQSVCCKEILYTRREVKPRMAVQDCGRWVLKHGGPQDGGACGDGHVYDDDSEVCPLGDDETCQSVCCKPTPDPEPEMQECASWILKHGGPQDGGACGDGWVYDEDSADCPVGDDEQCQSSCCKEILVY